MMHLAHAGFEIEVATLSGNPVKLEQWAMPTEDKAVMGYYDSILPKFKEPKRLSDIIGEVTNLRAAMSEPSFQAAMQPL